MQEKEIWKSVVGFELYEVSTLGRIRSLDRTDRRGHFYRGRILKPHKEKTGYLTVHFLKGQPRLKLHRLVWEAFNGPIPEGLFVNHNDENPLNNCLSNLSIMTCKENSNWGTRNERISEAKTNGKKSKPVCQYDVEGNIVRVFPSIREVERVFGFDNGLIGKCCKGKVSKAYGYKWGYKEAQ